MTLRGQNFSSAFSHECFGSIVRVSADSEFKPGDRVICLKPAKFHSELVVWEKLCIRYSGPEPARNVVGTLLPTGTALHAPVNIGRVRTGEVSSLEIMTAPKLS